MTDKHNASRVKTPSIDWSAQTIEPEDIQIGVMRFNRDAASRAANLLVTEANRYPDQITVRTLKRPIDEINEDVRSGLLFIGLELIGMSALSITTETESSPDTDFHLLTEETSTGVFVITLQVPVIIGEKGDKGDKGDTGDTGEPGADGLPGADGEKGDKGDTGDTGAKGDTGDTGAKGDKGDTGDTGAQGEQGEPGTPATTNPATQTPTESISPGDCVSYNLVMAGNGQAVLPVIIQEGYTIQVSEMVGASSDNAFDLLTGFPAILPSPWYCPDGNKFILGSCEPGSSIDAITGDPAQDFPHMVLLASINGDFYPVYNGDLLTVPAGVSDVLAIFQLNDGVLYDNQGQIEFLVEVCNPEENIWCYRFDDTHRLSEWSSETWSGSEPLATYSSGKWHSATAIEAHTLEYTHLRWELDSAITITDAGIIDLVNSCTGTGQGIYVNGDGSIFSGTEIWSAGVGYIAGTYTGVTSIDILVFCVDDGTADINFGEVQFSGSGLNPFGVGNC